MLRFIRSNLVWLDYKFLDSTSPVMQYSRTNHQVNIIRTTKIDKQCTKVSGHFERRKQNLISRKWQIIAINDICCCKIVLSLVFIADTAVHRFTWLYSNSIETTSFNSTLRRFSPYCMASLLNVNNLFYNAKLR